MSTQPRHIVIPSPHGNIAVEVNDRIVLDGIDIMDGYRPALAPELVDKDTAFREEDHGITGSYEPFDKWEEAGVAGPLSTCPPLRYTVFSWCSDGGHDYREECGWKCGGGYYVVHIGFNGAPVKQSGHWFTFYCERAISAFIGSPVDDRDLTEAELEEIKADLAAAAALGFDMMY